MSTRRPGNLERIAWAMDAARPSEYVNRIMVILSLLMTTTIFVYIASEQGIAATEIESVVNVVEWLVVILAIWPLGSLLIAKYISWGEES